MEKYGFTWCRTVEILHQPVQVQARTALEKGQFAKSSTSQLTLLTDLEYTAGISWLTEDIKRAEERNESFYVGADLRVYATIGWIG